MSTERKKITKKEFKTWYRKWEKEYIEECSKEIEQNPHVRITFVPFTDVVTDKIYGLFLDNDMEHT